jgi:hypothetical protein
LTDDDEHFCSLPPNYTILRTVLQKEISKKNSIIKYDLSAAEKVLVFPKNVFFGHFCAYFHICNQGGFLVMNRIRSLRARAHDIIPRRRDREREKERERERKSLWRNQFISFQ